MQGVPLYRAPREPEAELALQAAIDSATAQLRTRPADPGTLLDLGQRLADAGWYREAIATFSRGIRLHPSDPRFYRLRGASYITCRMFDLAIADLELATELAGAPAPPEATRGSARPSPQAATAFHLGLAHYLRRDYDRAAPHFSRVLRLAAGSDLALAAGEWLYLAYRRLDRRQDAEQLLRELTDADADGQDPGVLARLRVYRGELPADSLADLPPDRNPLSAGRYASAAWYLLIGERERGRQLLRTIVQAPRWDSPGYIAAEVELDEER